ncbi:hypothetical protein NKI12_06450 [Mesorhizobium australicum]|uniref:Uncharacterized protein n=1 Tax=Mesorhizobium australicum TaxID=536018 RepID=A0ACC6SSX1_9HYPH
MTGLSDAGEFEGGIGTTYNLLGRLYVAVDQAIRAGDVARAKALRMVSEGFIEALLETGVLPGMKADDRPLPGARQLADPDEPRDLFGMLLRAAPVARLLAVRICANDRGHCQLAGARAKIVHRGGLEGPIVSFLAIWSR